MPFTWKSWKYWPKFSQNMLASPWNYLSLFLQCGFYPRPRQTNKHNATTRWNFRWIRKWYCIHVTIALVERHETTAGKYQRNSGLDCIVSSKTTCDRSESLSCSFAGEAHLYFYLGPQDARYFKNYVLDGTEYKTHSDSVKLSTWHDRLWQQCIWGG